MVLVFSMLALPVGVALGGEAGGGNDGAQGEGHRPPPPGVIGKFILAHAQELSLTDDQKQKVQAWLDAHPGDGQGKPGGDHGKPGDGQGKPGGGHGKPGEGAGKPGEGAGKAGDGKAGKGPFADILTEEQHNKLREMLKAERPKGGHPPAGGGQQPQK